MQLGALEPHWPKSTHLSNARHDFTATKCMWQRKSCSYIHRIESPLRSLIQSLDLFLRAYLKNCAGFAKSHRSVVLLELVNVWIWIMAALISWHWDIFWWPPCSTPAMEYQPRAPRMLSAAVIYRKKTQLKEPKLCRRLQPRLWSKPAEMACWDLRSIYGPTFQDEAWKDMEGCNEILWVWVW